MSSAENSLYFVTFLSFTFVAVTFLFSESSSGSVIILSRKAVLLFPGGRLSNTEWLLRLLRTVCGPHFIANTETSRCSLDLKKACMNDCCPLWNCRLWSCV